MIASILFGRTKHFSRRESIELKSLFEQKKYDQYNFKLFKKIKDQSKGKYTIVNDEIYYTVMAPAVADYFRQFKENDQIMSLNQFQKKLEIDYTMIDIILDYIHGGKKFLCSPIECILPLYPTS